MIKFVKIAIKKSCLTFIYKIIFLINQIIIYEKTSKKIFTQALKKVFN